jgi:hypothetical protein
MKPTVKKSVWSRPLSIFYHKILCFFDTSTEGHGVFLSKNNGGSWKVR